MNEEQIRSCIHRNISELYNENQPVNESVGMFAGIFVGSTALIALVEGWRSLKKHRKTAFIKKQIEKDIPSIDRRIMRLQRMGKLVSSGDDYNQIEEYVETLVRELNVLLQNAKTITVDQDEIEKMYFISGNMAQKKFRREFQQFIKLLIGQVEDVLNEVQFKIDSMY